LRNINRKFCGLLIASSAEINVRKPQERGKHPGKPLIFQRTIYREKRNFNTDENEREADRLRLADSLMNVACRHYKDVYYIKTTCATSKSHEATVDGIHPDNYGYSLWEQSIEKPILRILRKYGIR